MPVVEWGTGEQGRDAKEREGTMKNRGSETYNERERLTGRESRRTPLRKSESNLRERKFFRRNCRWWILYTASEEKQGRLGAVTDQTRTAKGTD